MRPHLPATTVWTRSTRSTRSTESIHSNRSGWFAFLARCAVPVACMVACLVACLAGPSGDARHGGPAADGVPVARAVKPGEIVLPFDAYRFGDADRRTIARATTLLLADCMRDHGFAGVVPPVDPAGESWLVAPNSRRYGVVDAGVATRYGYHFPPDPGAARRAAAYRGWEARLTARQRDAFEGRSGNGGCVAAADRKLRARIRPARSDWFTPLDFSSLDRSAADPRVRAATARWRSCMSRRGMRYGSPVEAISDPRWNLDSPAPTAREVDTATADVECKREARLVATWLTAESELQRALISQRAGDFTDLARGDSRYVANAREVLTHKAARTSRR